MKKFFSLLVIITVVSFQTFGQEKDQKIEQLEALESDSTKNETVNEAVSSVNDTDTSTVEIGKNLLKIEEAGDKTKITIGNKELTISDDGDDTDIDFGKIDDEDMEDWEDVGGPRNFKGHLEGIELGFNSYGSDYFSTSLPDGAEYMDLNSAKSSSFNIVFPSVNLGFSRHFGLTTAIGLNFNNYRFDGNLVIDKDPEGNIAPFIYTNELEKSKLATVYAMVPVILEAQIPVSNGKTINIGAGVVGAIKIGSHTKVMYFDDGRQKEKNRDDFNLNLLRYGATARLGYEMFQVYATTYFTPLFEKGKGPELYPFEVGISLSFND